MSDVFTSAGMRPGCKFQTEIRPNELTHFSRKGATSAAPMVRQWWDRAVKAAQRPEDGRVPR